MSAHARYLRYVLMHKWYVFICGLQLHRNPRWIARLLIHDLSKFRPSEWRPYVEKFYGKPFDPEASGDETVRRAEARTQLAVNRAFDVAWLKHQHRNPHHWQHYVLREDSGITKVLLMPMIEADEMLADWLGAGTKILRWPSIRECISETIQWYVANSSKIQMRQEVRTRVEALLVGLAGDFHVANAEEIQAARERRGYIVLPQIEQR